jgi:hypothetical protein
VLFQVDAAAAAEALRKRGPLRVKEFSLSSEAEAFESLNGECDVRLCLRRFQLASAEMRFGAISF